MYVSFKNMFEVNRTRLRAFAPVPFSKITVSHSVTYSPIRSRMSTSQQQSLQLYNDSAKKAFLQMRDVEELAQILEPYVQEKHISKIILAMNGKKITIERARKPFCADSQWSPIYFYASISEKVTGKELQQLIIASADDWMQPAEDLPFVIHMVFMKPGESLATRINKQDKFDNAELPDVIKTLERVMRST